MAARSSSVPRHPIETEEIIDVGRRSSSSSVAHRGEGAASRLIDPLSRVVVDRTGRIVGSRTSLDRDEALEAAGLSE